MKTVRDQRSRRESCLTTWDLIQSSAGESAQIDSSTILRLQVEANLDVLFVLVSGVVHLVITPGLEEEVASLPADHRDQPAD